MCFRRALQTEIGRQLRVECELPNELVPELTTLLARMGEEHEELTPTPSHRLAVELAGRANAGPC
jgi:hypothetical protein